MKTSAEPCGSKYSVEGDEFTIAVNDSKEGDQKEDDMKIIPVRRRRGNRLGNN